MPIRARCFHRVGRHIELIEVGRLFLDELPVRFYLLTIVVWTARDAAALFVLLAWLYVALLLTHAYVHVTANETPLRGTLFIAIAMVLCVMWIISQVGILTRA